MKRRTAFITGSALFLATLTACGGATTATTGAAGSAGAGAGTGGAGGTGGATAGSDAGPPTPTVLEIYSWLVSGSDKTALDNLLNELRKRYPGISVVNAAAAEELPKRVASGMPPDSFQVIVGTDLRSWDDKGALESLDALSAAQGWAQVFPKGVLDAAAAKIGVLLGVPLDVERSNTLFFNKAVLQAHGMSAPSGVAEFFTVAAALKSQGVTALAVSASGGWTIGSQMFESVLVREAGPDFVQAYLAGQKAADAPEIQMALADVGRMMDYANADRATTGWGDAVKMVCDGDAAMLFLPDFVRGEFANRGCGSDRIGYVAMEPVGLPTYVFVSLGFTLPKQAAHRDSAVAFLEVAASAEGQRVFNTARGSIPARTDVPAQGFDPISQMSMKDFAAPGERLVLGYAAATSADFQTAVNPALQAFVDPSSPVFKDVATVLTVLRQNYATIAR